MTPDQSENHTGHASRQDKVSSLPWHTVFYGFLFILTVLSLYPLWANRLLPMQDYPQHLFLAKVMATYDDPFYNWREYYAVDLKFSPYMLWYLAMRPLSMLFDVEVAGKILFSLYILLISLVVQRSWRLCPDDVLPWGALLFFPFAFNQIYFMGFPNYIIVLPILILAVLDLEELAQDTLPPWRITLHAIYLCLLYLGHPYTVLVYVCLAVTTASCSCRNRQTTLRLLTPAVPLLAMFMFWYALHHGPSPAPNPFTWHITWLPLNYSILYYTLMFTGMRFTNGPDWLAMAVWTVIAATVFSAWQQTGERYSTLRLPLALFGASVAGFLVLPFWFGYYSYFNLRMAPVSYFLLALLIVRLAIRPLPGVLIACCAVLLVMQTNATQAQLSRSSEALLPLLANTNKNALVLPLIFREDTTVIDPVFYGEYHRHESSYYHVITGGGANPGLFRSAMVPVQYQPGIRLPFPERPDQYTWQTHGIYYDYILLREAPPGFSRHLQAHCSLIATSGPWELFRNRTRGTSAQHRSAHE